MLSLEGSQAPLKPYVPFLSYLNTQSNTSAGYKLLATVITILISYLNVSCYFAQTLMDIVLYSTTDTCSGLVRVQSYSIVLLTQHYLFSSSAKFSMAAETSVE